MTNQHVAYHVDLVLCIDSTGSMTHIIENVKNHAIGFHKLLQQRLTEKSKFVDIIRVRVLAFRDFYDNGIPPLLASNFFVLSQDESEFKQFVSTIQPIRGYSNEESGLEALAIAMQSAWTTGGDRRRHVIVMWTDEAAHPLEKRPKPAGYPSNILSNYNELADLWHGQLMDARAKRLVIFAPETTPWSDIATHWNQVIYLPSQAGKE
jgi:hypothetical protein